MAHKSKLIIMMGAAETARSTMADIIKESHDDCIIIRKAKIREKYYGGKQNLYDEKIEEKVDKEYFKKIYAALKKYDYVVADSVQNSIKARKNFFNNVPIPQGTKIIGVWIESTPSVALKNNSKLPKDQQYPESIIRHMFKYAASPQPYEPFDNVVFLNAETDMGITRLTAKIVSVVEALKNI